MFDAIALLTSAEATDDLVKEAAARDFVAEAFQHCKFISYDRSALPLLEVTAIAHASTRAQLHCREKKG